MVSVTATGRTAYHNGSFSVFSYGHDFWSSESELSENVFAIKRMGSVPKNSVPSQHSHQSSKYKTEQPFISDV